VLWFVLALFCAISLATSDALVKRALERGYHELLVAWLRLLWTLPVVLPLYASVPAPVPGADFYRAALLALPLELIALILYVKALKLSPLSLTVPFLSLTPMFLLVVPTLLLGERVTPAGALGVALIGIGSYVLQLRKRKEGFFAPLRSILHEPGSLCMIGVALIYSFTSTLGKQAISAASPLVFAAFYFPLLALLMTPLALWQARGELTRRRLQECGRVTFLPGLFYALMLVSHMYAISMVNVAYMISVKRFSLVIGVVYGHLLFGEEGLAERLLGACLMVAGVALILIAGSG
jgi:drug/metabolite transporter (DMT)-like permease